MSEKVYKHMVLHHPAIKKREGDRRAKPRSRSADTARQGNTGYDKTKPAMRNQDKPMHM
jgi:hypothetical protein